MAFRDPEDPDEIFGDLEPRIRRRIREAFGQSVEELRDQFTLGEIADMIEQSASNSAAATSVAALIAGETVRQSMIPVANAYEESLMEAGASRANEISGNVRDAAGESINFEFRPGHPETAERVRNSRLRLIRELSDEQESVVRNAVADGLQRGENPRQTARTFRDSIGLTQKQERAVNNYRRMLEEGDRGALDRDLRDRRFDSSVRRAAAGEKTLTQQQIDRMTERYRQRMLRHRSEVIARTESLRALSEARHSNRQQMIDRGLIDESQVQRFWVTARDERVRSSHRRIPSMNREGVGHRESFDTPLGPLRFPRDPMGIASNTVQCRCAETESIEDADPTGPVVSEPRRDQATDAPAPDQTDTTPDRFRSDQDIGDELRRLGAADGNEHLIAMDRQGRELFRTTSGANSAVSVDREQLSIMRQNGNVITHHNHPDDSSLSLQDLRSQGATPGEIEVQAHGAGGASFGGSVVDEGRFPFRTPDQDVQAPVAESFRSVARKGVIGQTEAAEIFSHVQNRALQRAGIIDYRARLTDRQADIESRIFGDSEFMESFEGLVQRFSEGFE